MTTTNEWKCKKCHTVLNGPLPFDACTECGEGRCEQIDTICHKCGDHLTADESEWCDDCGRDFCNSCSEEHSHTPMKESFEDRADRLYHEAADEGRIRRGLMR